MKKYGQVKPPVIDIGNIKGKVKIAMFVGTSDDLGDPQDNRWARDVLRSKGSALMHYEEMTAGHTSFLVGKDMTFVDRAIEFIHIF